MLIEQLLKDHSVTKAELARRIGVQKQSINNLLKNPCENTARKIAKALDLELWELYFYSEREKNDEYDREIS